MFCKALIDKCIIRRQQGPHVAIFAHHTVEEQLRLAPHRREKILVGVGIQVKIRDRFGQTAQVQPLTAEVSRQCFRARVGQHAPHLLLEQARILEFPPAGHGDELLVGAGAPQEIRQT